MSFSDKRQFRVFASKAPWKEDFGEILGTGGGGAVQSRRRRNCYSWVAWNKYSYHYINTDQRCALFLLETDASEISTFPRKKERELKGGAMKFFTVFWEKSLWIFLKAQAWLYDSASEAAKSLLALWLSPLLGPGRSPVEGGRQGGWRGEEKTTFDKPLSLSPPKGRKGKLRPRRKGRGGICFSLSFFRLGVSDGSDLGVEE